MKALILNSGLGTRMGIYTKEHPKCMTEISRKDTILSRQLHLIAEAGITEYFLIYLFILLHQVSAVACGI